MWQLRSTLSQRLQVNQTVRPGDNVILGTSSIDDVVGLEHECSCDIWVKDVNNTAQ